MSLYDALEHARNKDEPPKKWYKGKVVRMLNQHQPVISARIGMEKKELLPNKNWSGFKVGYQCKFTLDWRGNIDDIKDVKEPPQPKPNTRPQTIYGKLEDDGFGYKLMTVEGKFITRLGDASFLFKEPRQINGVWFEPLKYGELVSCTRIYDPIRHTIRDIDGFRLGTEIDHSWTYKDFMPWDGREIDV